jgi:hypothetical protein
MLVAALDAPLRPAGLEVADADANRDTGPAAVTERLVDEMMGAAEASVGQRIMLGDRVRPAQFSHELGLQAMRQVRATHRRRGAEKPKGLDVLADEHVLAVGSVRLGPGKESTSSCAESPRRGAG